jgi:hypothetical protein
MPATVRRAGTLTLTIDSEEYSCQLISVAWSFVGEEIYTACSPTDGAALVGRAGDGALYELTVQMLADYSDGALDEVMLTDTVGEKLDYDLVMDSEGDGTWSRRYQGDLLVPHVLEEWEAGTIQRNTLTFPVLTRTVTAPYDATP